MNRASRKRFDTDPVRETGAIRKDWRGRIRVALVFPNRYQTGMANLGFQQVYRIINASDAYVCERAFLPDTGSPPVSVETHRPLSDFDIIAFSLSFENDYPNILSILERGGVPFMSRDREARHPLVVAGGVACMLNPEPLAPFIDCFLIGEAEVLLPPFLETFDPAIPRNLLLQTLARTIPGVYVPAFYQVSYHADGTLAAMRPDEGAPEKIERVFQADLSTHAACSTILTDNAAFSDGCLVEVSRGCPHGCRFCGAGFVYRPPRFRPTGLLMNCLEEGARRSGHVGLVGASVSDLPDLDLLCRAAQTHDVRLSFSSLRADNLTDTLVSSLYGSGVKTATIAPDAGSRRMREVINKGITEEEILSAVCRLVGGGIPNLKLYFMVGLPTETAADVDEIIGLCRRVKEVFLQASRPLGRIGDITVAVSSFVPKPATPFQWAAMDGISSLKKKIDAIQQGLKTTANLRVHADTPRQAYVQAFLSRGDRRVSEALLSVHRHQGNWPQTLRSLPLDMALHVTRTRAESELFPWDIIDHRVDKTFLWREYQRALNGESTPECPADGNCERCGVCKSATTH